MPREVLPNGVRREAEEPVTRLHKRAALKLATGDLIINLNGGNEREAALFRAAKQLRTGWRAARH
jgi:hypothetical protein